jgi:hypothetical protein
MEHSCKTGDIIFIRINNPLYRRVAMVTRSWTSHVGIVVEEGGEILVAESTIPVSKKTPLAHFLQKSYAGQYAIKRLQQDLTTQQQERIRAEINQRLGIWYHIGFKYDSPRQFCSKFVYDVFYAALGIEIGRLETFRELLQPNVADQLWFWRLWFFGCIPWNRRTVTPASQFLSDALATVSAADSLI